MTDGTPILEERKQYERDFHNERYRNGEHTDEYHEEDNKRFYSVVAGKRGSRTYLQNWLDENVEGKRVLDYCCGGGEFVLPYAPKMQELHGIDISDGAIEFCQNQAQKMGFDHAHYKAGDAEDTGYPDDYFDIVFASGCLHHLDVHQAYPELARITKPTGRVICGEALKHNPLIARYRNQTPELRTPWESEHILGQDTIQLSQQWFDGIDKKFFHLADLGAVPFRNSPIFNPMVNVLSAVDRVILNIPGLQWQAWICNFVLSKPKK